MNGTEGKNGGAVGIPRAETEMILLSIDRPKSYCAAGRMFAPMPVLEIRGAGELSFPVPKDQAEVLSDRSASRPGETGRNGSEIGPEDARIGGGGWEKTLAGVLDAATEVLGCPRKDLGARSHVFICMLAYYVEWNMRRVWVPLMFTEDDPARPEKLPSSAVGPIRKSQSAKRKASSRKTAEGLAVQEL